MLKFNAEAFQYGYNAGLHYHDPAIDNYQTYRTNPYDFYAAHDNWQDWERGFASVLEQKVKIYVVK